MFITHTDTQHLTFTMPRYSLCTLKSGHFYTGHFCHASGHTVTSLVWHMCSSIHMPVTTTPLDCCAFMKMHIWPTLTSHTLDPPPLQHIFISHWLTALWAAVATHTAVPHCYVIIYITYPWLYFTFFTSTALIPTEVTMKPLNTAMTSFLAAILSKIKIKQTNI